MQLSFYWIAGKLTNHHNWCAKSFIKNNKKQLCMELPKTLGEFFDFLIKKTESKFEWYKWRASIIPEGSDREIALKETEDFEMFLIFLNEERKKYLPPRSL